MMTPAEFFVSPVACLLYSNESNRFKKYETATNVGTYRVLNVAIKCSRSHQSLFLNLIGQTEKTTQSDVSSADIIITDNQTVESLAIAPSKAWFVYYGMRVVPPHANELNLNSNPKIARTELLDLIEKLSRIS